jgi:hypothetical protein
MWSLQIFNLSRYLDFWVDEKGFKKLGQSSAGACGTRF